MNQTNSPRTSHGNSQSEGVEFQARKYELICHWARIEIRYPLKSVEFHHDTLKASEISRGTFHKNYVMFA